MDTNLIKPIIERLSGRLANDWPGIESDDIGQEMLMYVAQNWDKSIAGKPEDEQKKLVTWLAQRQGVSYCSRERYTYQHHSAEWVYTPREIRALLSEYYFTADAWKEAPKRPERGAQTLLGDGVVVALWDMQSAFYALSESDQSVIISAYHGGERLEDAERKRLERAVNRMAESLNKGIARKFDHTHHDGPGSRTVMSNAAARALTSNDYL